MELPGERDNARNNARCMQAMSLHPYICHKFGIQAKFCLFYTVLYRNLGSSKNKGTSLWNFVPNSGLK